MVWVSNSREYNKRMATAFEDEITQLKTPKPQGELL